MSYRAGLTCAFIVLLAATRASAGAWTLPQGDAQIIANATWSEATEGFGDSAKPDTPLSYAKLWTSITAEYGLTDDLTLNLEGDYAHAQTGNGVTSVQHAADFAYGGGLRYRIFDSFGILSAQATYKSAGAFDLSVSANDVGGKQADFRLLWGTNFKLFNRDGFFDAEAGERWLSGARPNETPIDLTVGIHVNAHNMVMLQNFNIIAGGDARPPFGYYRVHKIALSWVTGPWHGLSLQTGAFVSPAGQNSLVETGAFAAIWADF